MVLANHTGRAARRAGILFAAAPVVLGAICETSRAEDRTITGAGNNPLNPNRGAASTPFIRLGYIQDYPDGIGNAVLADAQRVSARTISNTLSVQTTSVPNNRNLSSYIWMWGQFLTHDLDHASTSNGSAVNGSTSITVAANDPLGPNPIGMTRTNFVNGPNGVRQQVNAITTWIDGSMVYGSDLARANALRTSGGTGAKLITTAGNLPGFNTAGLANDNSGPTPSSQLFLCGDVRANENAGLLAMHTLFVREHNRLVDVISAQQPTLNNQQKYQLARKIVGAEIQRVTYNEFLPALVGPANTPALQAFQFNPQVDATITQSFGVAAFRFGHSTLSSTLPRVNNDGTSNASLNLKDVSFNPNLIANTPTNVEVLLKGAATQRAQEIDTLFVDDVRNFLFGPPGAGGMDLSALNTQRGREHGLADYRQLQPAYGLPPVQDFNTMPTTPALRTALQNLYGNINNVDAYIAGLAENHVPGSSLGPLFTEIIQNQFTRLRDGDRLFYLGNDAGLYLNGVLLPEVASILNLDTVRLSDILAMNTGLSTLQVQGNVFFAQLPGDFNNNSVVNGLDIDLLFSAVQGASPTADLHFDTNADGTVNSIPESIGSDIDHLIRNIIGTEYGDVNLDRRIDTVDFNVLATNFGNSPRGWAAGDFNGNRIVDTLDFNIIAAHFGESFIAADAIGATVPEPGIAAMLVFAIPLLQRRRRT